MSESIKTLTSEEIKCFLITYEKEIKQVIFERVSTLEDLQFQRGKLHGIKVVFELLTNENYLKSYREKKRVSNA